MNTGDPIIDECDGSRKPADEENGAAEWWNNVFFACFLLFTIGPRLEDLDRVGIRSSWVWMLIVTLLVLPAYTGWVETRKSLSSVCCWAAIIMIGATPVLLCQRTLLPIGAHVNGDGKGYFIEGRTLVTRRGDAKTIAYVLREYEAAQKKEVEKSKSE
jgi:hypothetical protein